MTEGELNYFITKMILNQDPQSYYEWNKMIGMLECCKAELYRRHVAPYEELKAKMNGDV